MLTDEQKNAIREMAKTYRNGVRRGDFSASWAADDCAGRYTYPYATAAHFSAVRDFAKKHVH